jgi:predicted Zn-dependent protease with MMP-like domain
VSSYKGSISERLSWVNAPGTGNADHGSTHRSSQYWDENDGLETMNPMTIQRQLWGPAYNAIDEIHPMAERASPETFDEIVEWAYSTLPQKIKDLPDFPGIQVADEPPEGYLKTRKRHTELFGLHVGVHRTERQWNDVRPFSNLIFVFRGPILRCSKGDLRAEVKRVVWHEVAHWLGHNEQEVKELGLSRSAEDVANHLMEGEASKTVLLRQLQETSEEAGNPEEEHLRCLKCYSPNVTCREVDKPISSYGAWLSDPLPVQSKMWTCNSCRYEWNDDDNA